MTEKSYTLKQLRILNDMTQEEVAKKLEISKYTWGNWERGKTAPDFWQLDEIKMLFNIQSLDSIKFLPKSSI